jgi:transcriptional regulator with XRE-family HTH domain
MAQTTTTGKPTIGTIIRAWRLFHGFTPKELAAKAGVRPGYLSEVENDKKVNPWLSKLKQLTDALRIPLSYIEDRRMPDEDVKGFAPAAAVALGAGVGLGAILPPSRTGQQQTDTASQQPDQTIKLLIAQIAAESQLILTPEKKMLAEHLILENARSVCEVLAKEQDQQRR